MNTEAGKIGLSLLSVLLCHTDPVSRNTRARAGGIERLAVTFAPPMGASFICSSRAASGVAQRESPRRAAPAADVTNMTLVRKCAPVAEFALRWRCRVLRRCRARRWCCARDSRPRCRCRPASVRHDWSHPTDAKKRWPSPTAGCRGGLQLGRADPGPNAHVRVERETDGWSMLSRVW